MGNIISGSDLPADWDGFQYKMRGHNKLVIRDAGGASKSRVKSSNFEATRNPNREWTLVTE
jgi:hypothetical protein